MWVPLRPVPPTNVTGGTLRMPLARRARLAVARLPAPLRALGGGSSVHGRVKLEGQACCRTG